MHVQLLNYIDRYGNTNTAAIAVIMHYSARFPPQASQECVVNIYKDEAAFIAEASFLLQDDISLFFNPNSTGAETAAYNQLADAGGIYTGSTVIT